MTLHQIAENWNGQVTKLCNWTINRFESAADKDYVMTARTGSHRATVKPRDCAETAVLQ